MVESLLRVIRSRTLQIERPASFETSNNERRLNPMRKKVKILMATISGKIASHNLIPFEMYSEKFIGKNM